MLSPFPLNDPADIPEFDRIAFFMEPWPWCKALGAQLAPVKPVGAHMWDFATIEDHPGSYQPLPILRAWPDDIIAWSPSQPSKFRFWTGDGRWLGLEHCRDGVPGRRVALAASPLAWVAGGRRGLCALRADALLDLFPITDEIVVRDAAHAEAVRGVFEGARVPCPRVIVRLNAEK